jgi:hypothetical protein
MLATWNTLSAGIQGSYFIRVLYTTDHSHLSYVKTASINIRVNNHQYTANTAFHNYMSGGAVLSAAHDVDMIFDGAGGCISAGVGTAFTGKFKSLHEYFSVADLYVLPNNSKAVLSSGPVVTLPSVTLERSGTSLLFGGFANEAWSMNTGAMAKCGYVLVLQPYERTIYNNNLGLPYTQMSIGFAIV